MSRTIINPSNPIPRARAASLAARLCLATTLAAGCGGVTDEASFLPAVGQGNAPLFVETSTIWGNHSIPVCWENLSAGNLTERRWVQTAIAQTWEANASLDFTGWGSCTDGARGIHIRIRDAWPHTEGLGNELDGMNDGMVLNFTFNTWGTSCPVSDIANGTGQCMRIYGNSGGTNYVGANWNDAISYVKVEQDRSGRARRRTRAGGAMCRVDAGSIPVGGAAARAGARPS